jgi:hypothetical protein
MKGGSGRVSDYGVPQGLDGTDISRLADELVAYAEMGIAHVQLVLDPITASTIADLEGLLAILDA